VFFSNQFISIKNYFTFYTTYKSVIFGVINYLKSMNFIIRLFLSALAVIITSYLLPGVHVADFVDALIVAALLALFNATLKPILIILTIPITVITLGLFLLIINAFLIVLADYVITGFVVDSFIWALAFSLILSLIMSIFNGLAK
jgi:putative membrane protein